MRIDFFAWNRHAGNLFAAAGNLPDVTPIRRDFARQAAATPGPAATPLWSYRVENALPQRI